MQSHPHTRELVLIGGGHAHALVLRRWGMRPLPGARLTLINPGPTAPYTGMLPGFVAGHYGREDLEIDLVKLARFAGARLVLDRVTGIERDMRRIVTAGGRRIFYDIAALDIGITSDLPQIEGFAEHGVSAKPLGDYAQAWEAFLARPGPIVVIGGGVAGVELALAMAHRAGQPVEIVERGQALAGVGARARAVLLARLTAAGIGLREGAQVVRVGADTVALADGTQLAARLCLSAAGARPQDWLARTGLALQGGYVAVDAQLRSSDPAIYAAGDCAHFAPAPRPKAGVYAVRAAPVLAHNLRADLTGSQRRDFRPQGDYLKLVSLGEASALGEKFGIVAQGAWVWRWKDRIDRQFMDRLSELPAMVPPAPPSVRARGDLPARPLCGGCGAKLASGVLDAVLEGPGDDAAVLETGGQVQVISTDHLRGFTLDPAVMARVAMIHALGDIWAMGAQVQGALAQVILPPLEPRLQPIWLAEIMAAAREVIEAEGGAILGGHSTQGAELSIGFTVTGLAARAIPQGGARAGDALILTRPVGSGVLLAAEMAGRARGGWIAGLFSQLCTPQGAAARILGDAHAMTDVTGFGLAGHAARMARASNLVARIEVAAVPLYPGALEMSAQGQRASLFEANCDVLGDVPGDPRAALMADPQTAGGLLAAVEAAQADDLLAALRKAGCPAARIGQMVTGAPGVALI